MYTYLGAVLCLALAAPAAAHDVWIQPRVFAAAGPVSVPITLLIGHGAARQRWGVSADRIIGFRSIGPGGVIDRKPELRMSAPRDDGAVSFTKPGGYIVALESTHAQSDLPAARFEAYLDEEGLTPAQEHRRNAGTSGRDGREIYSRRGKALVQIGPLDRASTATMTRALGQTLEIVPERNPYALKPGDRLPVKVLYQGRALAGATIKLRDLNADAEPVATRTTDRAGRATFAMPDRGIWLLNVVWTQPITDNPAADFDTTFSSLTFGSAGDSLAR